MSNFESKPPSIGLWKNDRGPYASGNCGGIRFVLWENRDKSNPKAPDFRLVLEAPQPREREQQPSDSGGGGGMPDDSIPFGPEVR